MSKVTFEEALEIVYNDIKNMTQEEFEKELKKHEDGELSKILLEIWSNKKYEEETT